MTQSHMLQEVHEIPDALERLFSKSAGALSACGAQFRELDPAVVVTIARGTSDHAAGFLKYAIELQAGVPVASIGPSLASIYQRSLKLKNAAAIAISQSGKSPDIVALAQSVTDSGARSVALVNTVPSPLASACSVTVPLEAGPELAVAATKSYVASVVAGLAILAEWTQDDALKAALSKLPDHCRQALDLDWGSLTSSLVEAQSLYFLGRGPSLAVAAEAALKCKETCELHGEAYSSAEVLHGPVSLVGSGFPVLVFAAADAAEASAAGVADKLAEKGGTVFSTSPLSRVATVLPTVRTGHPLTDALIQIVPYYKMVERLSFLRDLNPDAPAALQKVTETL
ncbi:SIS domain-containing protein [Roseibium litorale]|uniref:SIS domain-containing protein n=1 Tax=Roseibium litorale TaxID=2803841 RepID=A0ABR9CK55_9HYPH|nr:SIS domain-containing protein [Roseibium litorale]MBD8891231.1 SIS domain-containing protein [Roseibium litorale]